MTQPGYPVYGSPNGPNGPASLQQPGPFPSYPPTASPSIPPSPKKPPRSPLPLVLGLGGGAVALLVVVGVGVGFYMSRSKSVALPVDAKLLPGQTTEVATQLIEATREPDERVKRAYLAAELGAELCRTGASDPARRLESIGLYGSRAAKSFFFDKKQLEDTASLLDCGALLGASLQSPYEAVISLEAEENKPPQRIAVGHFTFTELPSKYGFARQNFAGIDGFCRTQVEDRGARIGDNVTVSGRCDDRSHGAFAQGTTWFLGEKASVETMAAAVKRPKDELNSRISALNEAASQTEGLPVVRLRANPKSSREFFASPCQFGAYHSAAPFKDFTEGCFPGKDIDRLLEGIDAKIKAAAFEMDGDPQKAAAIHGNIVFVARDNDGAKKVERDVKEVVSEWKSHLDTHEAKLVNQSRELARTSRHKKFAAFSDKYFTALKNAKVTRSGRSIRVSFSEKLGKEDILALEDADRTTVDKRRAVAEVLEAVQARKNVPEAPLAKLVGPAWAKFLAGPAPAAPIKAPMAADDCRALQARLATMNLGDLPTTEAKSMFITQRYAPCATRAPEITAPQRTCLLNFKNAAEYARCAPNLDGSFPNPNEPAEALFGDERR